MQNRFCFLKKTTQMQQPISRITELITRHVCIYLDVSSMMIQYGNGIQQVLHV